MKKWIFLMVVVVLIAAGALYHAPRVIKQELQGMIYSEHNDFERSSKILLTGDKYPNLLGKPVIKGTLSIDEQFVFPVTLKFNGSMYSYTMVEWGEDKAPITTGTITASSDLNSFTISLQAMNDYYGLSEAWLVAPPVLHEE